MQATDMNKFMLRLVGKREYVVCVKHCPGDLPGTTLQTCYLLLVLHMYVKANKCRDTDLKTNMHVRLLSRLRPTGPLLGNACNAATRLCPNQR